MPPPKDPAKYADWIEKNRLAHIGKKQSDEQKRKTSESMRGDKNHFFGKNHTDEARHKMSEAKKNPSEDYRKKLSDKLKCIWKDPSYRNRVILARVGKCRSGDKINTWKGDCVGYDGLHHWIRRHKPPSETCEHCHQKKPLQAANISGEYKRDVNDYIWLCRKCHTAYDEIPAKMWAARRMKIYFHRKTVNMALTDFA